MFCDQLHYKDLISVMVSSRDMENNSEDYFQTEVSEFMDSTRESLRSLMGFREEAIDKLNRIETLERALENLARHAENMDKTLVEIKEAGRDWMAFVMGKKHVPLSIFFFVIFLLAVIMVVDKVGSRGEISMSPTEFKYKATIPSRYERFAHIEDMDIPAAIDRK